MGTSAPAHPSVPYGTLRLDTRGTVPYGTLYIRIDRVRGVAEDGVNPACGARCPGPVVGPRRCGGTRSRVPPALLSPATSLHWPSWTASSALG